MNASQQTSWAPQPGGVAALALGGLAMAAACVMLVTDLPGRVLTGIAAVGLLVFATNAAWLRPKLAIAEQGLLLRGWRGTAVLRRDQIKRIRITEFRRIGRRVRMLEIETHDDQLRVFTRWDLGVDPIQVLDALTAAGYTR